MRPCHAAVAVAALSPAVQAQNLVIGAYPSQSTARLGDVVTWTIIAELDSVPSDRTVLATVLDIGFGLDYGGDAGVELSNNAYLPAFDGLFPAVNGTASGDSITGAVGSQSLSPLGTPDSSNPLSIYTYDMLITDDTERTIFADITIVGQFTGAYEDGSFGEVFFYQRADGSAGTVPFSAPPLLFLPTLTIVPAPASVAVLASGVLLMGRRRRG